MISSVYAYGLNPNATSTNNSNLDINNNINNYSKYSALMPGNLTMGFASEVFASIINSDKNLIDNTILYNYKLYQGSLAKLITFNQRNLSSFFNNNYNYTLTNIFDKNVFDSLTLVLDNNVLKSLDDLNKNPIYSRIINDGAHIESIMRNSFSSKKWNLELLEPDEYDLISELLGTTNSIFFNLWYYHNAFLGNIGNIFEMIQAKYNLEFSNLLKYLWTSYDTYYNLVLFSQSLNGTSKVVQLNNALAQNNPISNVLLSELKPFSSDIDFMKNDLVKVTDPNNIQLLCGSQNQFNYQTIPLTTFNERMQLNIATQQDWNKYIDNNSLTSVGLYKVYNDLIGFKPELYGYKFRNINFNPDSFISIFEFKTDSNVYYWWGFFIMELSLIAILFLVSAYMYKVIRLNRR